MTRFVIPFHPYDEIDNAMISPWALCGPARCVHSLGGHPSGLGSSSYDIGKSYDDLTPDVNSKREDGHP
jgi:hypothetical protein